VAEYATLVAILMGRGGGREDQDMRIYLDLCAIQRPFDDDRTQRRIREEAEASMRVVRLIEQGTVELVTSFALDVESDASDDPLKRGYTESVLSLTGQRLEPSDALQRRTDEYKAQGLKTWDATHLAVAVEARVDFFCTCDDRLLRRAKAVDTGLTRAVSLLELIKEVEK
jgi:predicted nucleic acid-binding protein